MCGVASMRSVFCWYSQAYASVLRPLCDAASPPAPLLTAVVSNSAVEALLDLVQHGLDLSLPWLRAGVAAGADVLHLLLQRMHLDSGPASPLSAALEANLAPKTSGASVRSNASRTTSWSAISRPMERRAAFKPQAAGAC